MTSPRNPLHVKQGHEGKELDEDLSELQENNERRGAETLPGEEPHDVRKAGGGVKGMSMGGALTGRYAGRPENRSNRETRPRGKDVR